MRGVEASAARAVRGTGAGCCRCAPNSSERQADEFEQKGAWSWAAAGARQSLETFVRGSHWWKPIISEILFKSPLKVIQIFNHYPESTKQLQTHTSPVERLVKTETVIHKFTKIPCSTEQCDSSADRSNISIQTGFGAGAINIPAIFPASEHKDSFTVLIK